MFNDLRQDIRLAFSQLRQRPMFVAGATLSLAIGMSIATALFTVVDTLLRHPIALPNAERLIVLGEISGDNRAVDWLPARVLTSLREQSSSIEAIAAFRRWSHLVGPNGDARRMSSMLVTTNYFDVLGLRPVRGHAFDESNAAPGDRSVIISYGLWRSDFASDPSIIGHTLRVNGQPRTIIAVMPPAADFDNARIWMPISAPELNSAAAADEKTAPSYAAVGRLRPGATVAEAMAEARVVEQRVYGVPKVPRVLRPRAGALVDYLAAPIRSALQIWAAAAVIILMLCAVNFATMSLARGMRRRAEIAVRAAVGASRYRLARMLVVEAVLFALFAGALAILFAWWLLGFVRGEIDVGGAPFSPIVSWSTIAFAVLGTAVVGFVFAMAPALELAKVDLRTVMQAGASATTKRGELRGRRALVTLQLGLALAAVAVVVALIQADRRFQVASVGFDYERLLIANVAPSDSATRRVTLGPLLDQLGQTAGVEAVAATGSRDGGALWTDNGGDAIHADISHVSPTFFATLRVTPSAGRLPTDDEIRSEANVVVVQRSVAMALFGSETAALGQRVRMKVPRRGAESFTIVGVVPFIGGNGLYDFAPSLYSVRRLESERGGTVVLRATGDPQYRLRDVRRILVQFEQSLSASDLHTARSIVDATLNATRGRTIFLLAIGALAFILAIVGVYGLTAYTTELRSRELGIRIAMGAGHRTIAIVALEDVWWMAALGTTGGLAIAARAVAVLDNAYRNPAMPVPLVRMPFGAAVASAATLIVIMGIATALPLRRVFRIDVMRVVQGR